MIQFDVEKVLKLSDVATSVINTKMRHKVGGLAGATFPSCNATEGRLSYEVQQNYLFWPSCNPSNADTSSKGTAEAQVQYYWTSG